MQKKPPQQFERSIEQHRALVAEIKSPIIPTEAINKKEILVPIKENIFSIGIYRPFIAPLYPTIFFAPGTAFVAKDTGFTDVFCSILAAKTHCQVIQLDYRLAPEFPFPAAPQDVYDLFYYFVKLNPDKFAIDKNKIALAGYSSGGNLAALTAIKAVEQKLNIARQILISPMVDLSRSLTGFEEFEKQDSFLGHKEFTDWIVKLYAPKNVKLKNPDISPYWTNIKKLEKLIPTDIIFGEFDLLRGDAEWYRRKLNMCSVDTSGSYMFPKGDHCLLWINPIAIAEIIASRIIPHFNILDIPKPINIKSAIHFLKNIKRHPSLSISTTYLSSAANKKSEITNEITSHSQSRCFLPL